MADICMTNTAVECASKDEYDRLMSTLNNAGFYAKSYDDWWWNCINSKAEDLLYFNLDTNRVQYSKSREFYEKMGFKIITVAQCINDLMFISTNIPSTSMPTVCPECQGKKVVVLFNSISNCNLCNKTVFTLKD